MCTCVRACARDICRTRSHTYTLTHSLHYLTHSHAHPVSLSLSLSHIVMGEDSPSRGSHTYIHRHTDTQTHADTQTHTDTQTPKSRLSHILAHKHTDRHRHRHRHTHTHTWAYWERTAEDEAGRELARVAEGRVCPPPPPLEAACSVDASGVVLVEFDAGDGEACVCVRRPGPCTHTLALYSPPPPSPPSLSRLPDL